ncbi:hypothetical protein BLL52_3227 [Rhodoferax antarcticus ANT.BR]|uniref:Uncharacterized protein n=1 Tax=Rhodoferax antarcticus ANT.BR TaxID=1111071 RepID=A0A1Q8YCE2_9BURK|nr:hypothetical protein BLL52_3227 [Rhodoferax antarcticus ANT.BR]
MTLISYPLYDMKTRFLVAVRLPFLGGFHCIALDAVGSGVFISG